MKALLYTKQEYCPHCESAKTLLQIRKIEYEEKVLGVDLTKEELVDLFAEKGLPMPRTVPQIFLDGQYIGGNAQLQELFKIGNQPDEE